MKDITELGKLVEQEIQKISYPFHPSSLYEPIEYIMGMKGKRMRPVLLLMAHQLFEKNIEKALAPALAMEIFHNFTLLHDDIMDDAPLRRGFVTVHEKWNKNTAILSGDTMLVQAYQRLTEVPQDYLKQLLNTFSSAAIAVCQGQQLDMDFESQDSVSLTDYIQMIEQKTAALLAASLKIGAILGGASKEDQDHLFTFGINLGIAFQLKDDLLDAFGNPNKFGKQIGGDIKSNKKTFLYLKALQIASVEQKCQLEQFYSQANNDKNKVEKVKAIFVALEIPKHTTALIKAYYTKAMKHLDAIESGNKTPLIDFANQLSDRIS